MGEVILKRYRREGGHDKKYYLSLFSLTTYSISEICSLTQFKDYSQIHGCRCEDWLCFHDCLGKVIIYNITTEQVKILPPYKTQYLNNPAWTIIENGVGMGYDSHSHDYKVVRSYTLWSPDDACTVHSEVYSLKNDVLKEIPNDCPYSVYSIGGGGIYIGGCFYWAVGSIIQCFDFATETYSYLRTPPCDEKKKFLYHVVDFCGSLCVIVGPPNRKFSEHWARPRLYTKPRPGEEEEEDMDEEMIEWSSRSPKRRRSFQLWVWKDESWEKLYDASLHHVVRPLCLIDGRISLFQGNTNNKECDLVMYDWASKEMKKFDICDYPSHLEVYTGVQVPLASSESESNRTYDEEVTKTAFLRPCVAASVRDEAKPVDMILDDDVLVESPSIGNASLDTKTTFLRPCVAASVRDEGKPVDMILDDEVPAERRRRRRRSRKAHQQMEGLQG